ncbi:MAG: hypothetical protein NZT61_02640 [Deltaproteobacteria bacterium]|nr:hypothetical protein [Deltaproteobacteria bacterium]MCX7952289.1 hypothetical protein [Deltaproteobacteria bacterium]
MTSKGLTLIEILIALVISIILIGGLIAYVFTSVSYVNDLNRRLEVLELEKSISQFFERQFASAVLIVPSRTSQIKIGTSIYLIPRRIDLDEGFHYIKKADPRSGVFFNMATIKVRDESLLLNERPIRENEISSEGQVITILGGVKRANFLFYDENADSPIGLWFPEWKNQSLPPLIAVSLLASHKNGKIKFFKIFKTHETVYN